MKPLPFVPALLPLLAGLAALAVLPAPAADAPSAPPAEAASVPPAAPVPAGWNLVLEQHFDSADALRSLAATDPKAWQFSANGLTHALELVRQSDYTPPVRSPLNIVLLADGTVGDFLLEADLVQTGREYGHRDLCLFFGFQDPSHFYYVHLATKADDHAHNVFLVNGAPRVKITRPETDGVQWGLGIWHKVRLERRLADGSIRVFFDDLARPVMTATDRTFGAGWIGFGSFDDTGKIDNVRLWSPAPWTARPLPFFQRLR